jgi:hypothetical protein
MAHYCTFWDWKEDPPFDEIEARVNALLERGATRLYFATPNCGRDDYCLVISDIPVKDDEAETKWEDWFGNLPDDDAYDWTEWNDPELD